MFFQLVLLTLLASQILGLALPPSNSILQPAITAAELQILNSTDPSSLNADQSNLVMAATTGLYDPTSLNGTLSSPDQKFSCLPDGFFADKKRPSFSECGGAIRLLPSSAAVGVFQSGGTQADFQMPTQMSFEKCRVNVGFVPGVTRETSSWLEISSAALQMDVACMKRAVFSGGATTVGNNGGIQISLSKFKYEE